jgi:hypothetical protein
LASGFATKLSPAIQPFRDEHINYLPRGAKVLRIVGQDQAVSSKFMGWKMDSTQVSSLLAQAKDAGDERLEAEIIFVSAIHDIAVALATAAVWAPTDLALVPVAPAKEFRSCVKVFKDLSHFQILNL